MSDLIKNLRDLAAFAHADLSVADEAAAEIERLRVRVEELERKVAFYVDDFPLEVHARKSAEARATAAEAQVATLREALFALDYVAHQLCVSLDVDPDETFVRVKNSRTDEELVRKYLSDIFVQVCAALEDKG